MQRHCNQSNQTEYVNLKFSSEHEISNLQPTGTIICITDPSGADIYIDGVLQPAKTSVYLTAVPTGNRTVTFSKTGYNPYIEVVSGLKKDQIVKVSTILDQKASIIDNGIVICTSSNITSCPTTPITCPTDINPLDYINFIAIINSIRTTIVTIRFLYSINEISSYTDVTKSLIIGTNIIFAFSSNMRYSPNDVISLDNVIII